jgi:hypothetical protein
LVSYDFHHNLLLQVHARCTENRTEGLGCTPMSTNHLADVFRMDAQLKHDHLLALDRTNLHLLGMVHESLSDHFYLHDPPPRVRLYQQEVERARIPTLRIARFRAVIEFSIGNATRMQKGG